MRKHLNYRADPFAIFSRAHHDMPVEFQRRFLKCGLDVNDGRWGRWLPYDDYHKNFHPNFNYDWKAFWDAEPATGYTQQEVINKFNQMRSSYSYP